MKLSDMLSVAYSGIITKSSAAMKAPACGLAAYQPVLPAARRRSPNQSALRKTPMPPALWPEKSTRSALARPSCSRSETMASRPRWPAR